MFISSYLTFSNSDSNSLRKHTNPKLSNRTINKGSNNMTATTMWIESRTTMTRLVPVMIRLTYVKSLSRCLISLQNHLITFIRSMKWWIWNIETLRRRGTQLSIKLLMKTTLKAFTKTQLVKNCAGKKSKTEKRTQILWRLWGHTFTLQIEMTWMISNAYWKISLFLSSLTLKHRCILAAASFSS